MKKWLKNISAILGCISIGIMLFFLFLPYGVYIEYHVKFNPKQAWAYIATNSPIEYVIKASETDQGATGSGRTIKAFVDAIGTTKKATIKVLHTAITTNTTYTLTTSDTITSNIALEMDHGAILDGAGTLTINGPFEHGLSQCFGSSITVVFGSRKESYPVWFGADNTGTVDSTTAWNSSIASITTGNIKASGDFLVKGTITVEKSYIRIVNDGAALAMVHAPTVADTDCIDFHNDTAGYYSSCGLKNITITGGANSRYLVRVEKQAKFHLHNVYLYGATVAQTALYIDGAMFNEYRTVSCTQFAGSVLEIVGKSWVTTTTDFYSSYFDQGTWGADITDGQRVNFYGCTFQSCSSGGMRIEEVNDLTGVSHVGLDRCHFEANPLAIRAGYGGGTTVLDVLGTRFIMSGGSTNALELAYVYAHLQNNAVVGATNYVTYTANIKNTLIIQNSLTPVTLNGPAAQRDNIFIFDQDVSAGSKPTFAGANFEGDVSTGTSKAQQRTFTQYYPLVANGAKLIIPIVSQGTLNSTTVCHVTGHTAENNNRVAKGFEISFSCGHIDSVDNLTSWNGGGNYSSIAINGMNIEITFTAAYAGGLFATISYMTNRDDYSIDVDNIAMD